uniref:Uncharacterized protein n=1 Tax=Arion vulgaris TaxID=1028688 RepID=A0A0B6ZP50_9EUPU
MFIIIPTQYKQFENVNVTFVYSNSHRTGMLRMFNRALICPLYANMCKGVFLTQSFEMLTSIPGD